MNENKTNNDVKPGYFDRPETKKMLWILLWSACILSLLLDVFLHRHGHFGQEGSNSIDGWFSFYAVLGFLSCLALIILSKVFGIFLKKNVNYYDD